MASQQFPQIPAEYEQGRACQYQEAMMYACNFSEIFELQQLLHFGGVKRGDLATEPKYGEPDPQAAPPPTWRLIYRSTDIVTFEFENWDSALVEACRGSNPLLPTYLLNNGAVSTEGGLATMASLTTRCC